MPQSQLIGIWELIYSFTFKKKYVKSVSRLYKIDKRIVFLNYIIKTIYPKASLRLNFTIWIKK